MPTNPDNNDDCSMPHTSVFSLLVSAIVLGACVSIAAQRGVPNQDRVNPTPGRLSPQPKIVPLRAGECTTRDCVAARLDEIGTDKGIRFAPLPSLDKNEAVMGVLCKCDQSRCYRGERQKWRDTNPGRDGWSAVKMHESSLFAKQLQDQQGGGTWVVEWEARGRPIVSWDFFLSKSALRPTLSVQCQG